MQAGSQINGDFVVIDEESLRKQIENESEDEIEAESVIQAGGLSEMF